MAKKHNSLKSYWIALFLQATLCLGAPYQQRGGSDHTCLMVYMGFGLITITNF